MQANILLLRRVEEPLQRIRVLFMLSILFSLD